MGIFDTNAFAGGSIEATDTITITRYTRSGADRNDKTATVIYQGPADVQIGTGDTYTDAGGPVQQADAIVLIDPAADGSFPDVHSVGTNGSPGDEVSVARVSGSPDVYTVVLVDPNTFPPAHLELTLKKGTGTYRGPGA